MRIAFDGSTLCGRDGGPGAGIEHYTVSLLRALVQEAPDDLFFVTVPSYCSKTFLKSQFGDMRHVRFLFQQIPTIPFVSRHLFVPLRLALHQPDLFFSPFGQLPFGWRGVSAITIHDLAIYDHPEWFSDESVSAFSTRVIVPWSIRKANAILTVSQDTQERLIAHFPEASAKVHVVSEGVVLGNQAEEAKNTSFPFDRDYVLFLGTVEPRKNLPNAFRAFHQFLEGHADQATRVRFVVAGRPGWKTQESEDVARQVNRAWAKEAPEGVIRFLGSVTEEEKWSLLTRASCLWFVSHQEGFGLPILEAMSVGTAVITSPHGALAEVGGDAVIYADPEDIEAMSFAIAQCVLLPEGVQYLREEGYRRARTFTWQKTARETMKVFRDI